ncbi:sigma-54 dependent response regulator [Chlamydia abortus]|nr:sigma-54 dependent response regulator [Chlamydia abortus]
MIRVLLVDDDSFIRESLKYILDMDEKINVLHTCSDGKQAYVYVCSVEGQVDVILMDIRMPECDGVEGTKLIKDRFPHIRVLILTTFDDDDYIIEAIKNGANGYMLKMYLRIAFSKGFNPYPKAICSSIPRLPIN